MPPQFLRLVQRAITVQPRVKLFIKRTLIVKVMFIVSLSLFLLSKIFSCNYYDLLLSFLSFYIEFLANTFFFCT